MCFWPKRSDENSFNMEEKDWIDLKGFKRISHVS